jgi:NhaP-type Na+/H+ and K+/H+ antiporter
MAAEFADEDPHRKVHRPPNPLDGYKLVELLVDADSRLIGTRARDVVWPAGAIPVAVIRGAGSIEDFQDTSLRLGDRVNLLAAEPPAT